jgi:hypothetical protein
MHNNSKKTDSPSSDSSSSIKTPTILTGRIPSLPRLIKTPRDDYDYTDDPPSPKLLLPLFEDEDNDELKKNYPRFNLKPRIRTSNI